MKQHLTNPLFFRIQIYNQSLY